MKLKVHGTVLSPWVRRLIAAIEEKGAEYELVNVVPLGDPDPEFLKISPLGKIPVLEANGQFLPDSLAACNLLDSMHPSPLLFPADAWKRSWMLWLCDFLATGVFSKVEAPLFIQRFINPNFRSEEPDQSIVQAALDAIPYHFNYLEEQLRNTGGPYFLGEEISLADITAGSIFVNFKHAGEDIDPQNWPLLSAHVERTHNRPSFQKILEIEREAVGSISPLFKGQTG